VQEQLAQMAAITIDVATPSPENSSVVPRSSLSASFETAIPKARQLKERLRTELKEMHVQQRKVEQQHDAQQCKLEQQHKREQQQLFTRQTATHPRHVDEDT
jgi:hypothetical protein